MIRVIFFAALALALAACVRVPKGGQSSLPTIALRVGQTDLTVELASTLEQQRLGLSGRESLEQGRGMLFVFNDLARRTFWMKGMRFPIDIVWIAQGKVVGVSANVPVPSGLSIPTVNSPRSADQVLEVPAGYASGQGWIEGAIAIFKIENSPE